MTDEAWPSPPREPGPWGGGPPVVPAGTSSVPPLVPGAPTPPPPLPTGPSTAGPSSPGSLPPAPQPWANPIGVGPAGPPGPTGLPGTFGGPPAPALPGYAPAPPKVDKAPRWVIGAAAAVLLAFIAGGVLMITQKESPYPDEWDPRVAKIADWVESQRGLDFEHPVDVFFLTPEEYSGESTGTASSDADLDRDAQDEMDEAIGLLRALGLVEGAVDLTAANNALADSGTLAFYSPQTESVYVRGTEMTPALEVTIAHELVHVLQDQHFDLERLPELDSAAATTLRAVAEGDAGRIEDDYVNSVMSDEDRAAYQEESLAAYEESTGELEGSVPPAMSALFASPYIFGPSLVDYLFATGGEEAINAALEDPPSEFALFDPINYRPQDNLAADQEVLKVNLPEGATSIEEGSFAPTYWYLVLAARTEPKVALAAVDGITADGYVNYRKDDAVCVTASAQAEGEDLAELTSALKDWASKSPDGTAEVTEAEDRVTLRSCDPGKEVSGLGSVSTDLLILPSTRTDVYVSWIEGRSSSEEALCFAQGIVDSFTVAELTNQELGNDPAVEKRITALADSCR